MMRTASIRLTVAAAILIACGSRSELGANTRDACGTTTVELSPMDVLSVATDDVSTFWGTFDGHLRERRDGKTIQRVTTPEPIVSVALRTGDVVMATPTRIFSFDRAFNAPGIPWFPNDRNIHDLRARPGELFYLSGGGDTSQFEMLRRATMPSEGATTLVDGLEFPVVYALDGDVAYVGTGATRIQGQRTMGVLLRVGITDHTVTVIETGTIITAVAADATSLYLAVGEANHRVTIRRQAKEGGATFDLVTNLAAVSRLLIDGSNLYALAVREGTDPGFVLRTPVDGGPVTVLGSDSVGFQTGIATNSKYVVWSTSRWTGRPEPYATVEERCK